MQEHILVFQCCPQLMWIYNSATGGVGGQGGGLLSESYFRPLGRSVTCQISLPMAERESTQESRKEPWAPKQTNTHYSTPTQRSHGELLWLTLWMFHLQHYHHRNSSDNFDILLHKYPIWSDVMSSNSFCVYSSAPPLSFLYVSHPLISISHPLFGFTILISCSPAHASILENWPKYIPSLNCTLLQ